MAWDISPFSPHFTTLFTTPNTISRNALQENDEKGEKVFPLSVYQNKKLSYISIKRVFDFTIHPFHQIAVIASGATACVGESPGEKGERGWAKWD